jgi:hypothetical protein
MILDNARIMGFELGREGAGHPTRAQLRAAGDATMERLRDRAREECPWALFIEACHMLHARDKRKGGGGS